MFVVLNTVKKATTNWKNCEKVPYLRQLVIILSSYIEIGGWGTKILARSTISNVCRDSSSEIIERYSRKEWFISGVCPSPLSM